MKRRTLLSLAPLSLLLPGSMASAKSDLIVEYSREAYQQARASGEPLLLDFFSKS